MNAGASEPLKMLEQWCGIVGFEAVATEHGILITPKAANDVKRVEAFLALSESAMRLATQILETLPKP